MSARQLATSLYGVWLLLRWDAAGFGLFERSFAGFCRSYAVAFAFLPVYAAHWLVTYDTAASKTPLAVYLFTETMSYVMSWTVYPLAMIYVARILDRDNRYFDYMVAYNWFQVAFVTMSLPISMLANLGVLNAQAATFLSLVAFGAFFAYGTFLAWRALLVGPLTGFGLVLLDFLLSLLVRQVIALV